jgi:hypothetical protein
LYFKGGTEVIDFDQVVLKRKNNPSSPANPRKVQKSPDERIYIRYEEPHLPHLGWAPRGSLFVEMQHASGRCTQFHYGLVNWGVVLRGKAW